jgi:hypothetical protein
MKLDSDLVGKYARKYKTFTTDEVANNFKVGRRQAAAAISILRIKDQVAKATPDKTPDGISRWVWVG